MPQKHTQHSCVAHPMYPELYKCISWESTFVEFCVDGINLFDENNFIDSLRHRPPQRLKLRKLNDACYLMSQFQDYPKKFITPRDTKLQL
jgi:hypothetical protein